MQIPILFDRNKTVLSVCVLNFLFLYFSNLKKYVQISIDKRVSFIMSQNDKKDDNENLSKKRNVSEAKKRNVAGKQYFKCANRPGSNITRIEDYRCPLWEKQGEYQGCFDESGYDIDHIVEHALTFDDSINNLQALCKSCHSVKTKRFMIIDNGSTHSIPCVSNKKESSSLTKSKNKKEEECNIIITNNRNIKKTNSPEKISAQKGERKKKSKSTIKECKPKKNQPTKSPVKSLNTIINNIPIIAYNPKLKENKPMRVASIFKFENGTYKLGGIDPDTNDPLTLFVSEEIAIKAAEELNMIITNITNELLDLGNSPGLLGLEIISKKEVKQHNNKNSNQEAIDIKFILKGMTVPKLLQLCDHFKVEYIPRYKKDQLIENLISNYVDTEMFIVDIKEYIESIENKKYIIECDSTKKENKHIFYVSSSILSKNKLGESRYGIYGEQHCDVCLTVCKMFESKNVFYK